MGVLETVLVEVAQRIAGPQLAMLQNSLDELRKRAENGDAEGATELLERVRLQLEAWETEVVAGKVTASELSAHAGEAARYGEIWWGRASQSLEERFATAPEEAEREWLALFSDALLDAELETCERLIALADGRLQSSPASEALLAQGPAALASGRYGAAAPMVALLLRANGPVDALSGPELSRHVGLLVLAGRVELRRGRYDDALRRFEIAAELHPHHALPHCGRGDYHLALGEHNRAESAYQEGIESALSAEAAPRPDAYLGLASRAEIEQDWEDADDWHEKAVTAAMRAPHPLRALGAALAPVTGMSLAMLAEALLKADPRQALEAAKAALEFGVSGPGDYPERFALHTSARALDALKDDEAAAAYLDCGRRYGLADEPDPSIECLVRSLELDPDNAMTHWELADSLRMRTAGETDPEPIRKLLERAERAWMDGRDRRAPERDEAWVYFTLAFIRDGLATGHDRRPGQWRAVAALERAVLLDPDFVDAWGQLARFYRTLMLGACAVETAGRALALQPENPLALLEHAAALSDIGRFDEARASLEKYRLAFGEWDPAADAVEAWTETHSGRPKEAGKLLDRIIDAGRGDLWDHDLRALTRRLTGNAADAMADYDHILEDPDVDGLYAAEVAYAAYYKRDYGRAAALITPLVENDQRDPSWVRFVAGIVGLASGDIEDGRALCAEAIRTVPALYSLDQYEFELSEVGDRVEDTDVVADLRSLIEAQRQDARSRLPLTAAEEAALVPERSDGDVARSTGALDALLARIASAAGEVDEAARRYESTDDEGQRLGAARAVDEGLERARTWLAAASAVAADQAAAEAASVIERRLPADADRAARARAIRVLARLAGGEQDVQDLLRRIGSDEAWQAVGDALREELWSLAVGEGTRYVSVQVFWQLERALDAMTVGGDFVAGATVIRSALAGFVEAVLDLDTEPWIEQPNRVAVTLGEGLVPEDTGDDWVLLADYVPAMRERIAREIGVTVPGVLFSRGIGIPAEAYTIELDGVVEESGEVVLSSSFCPDAGAPARLQIADAELVAPRPGAGIRGYWVSDAEAERLASADAEVWRDPWRYLVAHLELVLRRHLADHLEFEQVDALVESWSLEPANAPIVARRLPGPAERVTLGPLLRALVAEQVPLLDGTAILAALDECGPADNDPLTTLRALRLRLREQLPGNVGSPKILRLPASTEDELAEIFARAEDGRPRSPSSVEAARALGVLRSVIEPVDEEPALVVHRFELRPYIRRLIEAEFPDVAVLSDEELLLAPTLAAAVTEDAD